MGAAEFNGKTALLDFGRANPLGYADERTSMQMIKAGLEALGLQKGDDIKDKEMFANVVTTMVTSWTKEQGIKIAKATMAKEIDALRAICTEGSGDQAIQGVKAFVAGKQ
jgi:formylmethanofuran dehydrogenase subunit D